MTPAIGQSCARNVNKTARAIAFAAWAALQPSVPTVPQIVARYGADRDTAARWRRWFAGAVGKTLPPAKRGRPRA